MSIPFGANYRAISKQRPFEASTPKYSLKSFFQSCPQKLMPYTPEIIKQHINFWLPQFAQHALFIARDLHHLPTKRRFLQNLSAWRAVFKTGMQIDFLPVLYNLLANQKLLIDALAKNIPLGHVPIALVQHMIEEEVYFLKVLQNCISPEEEKLFWIRESAEHTRLAGQMVDPYTVDAIKKSDDILKEAHKLTELESKISKLENKEIRDKLQKALDGAIELQKQSLKQKYHLLIQSDMLQHEIREAKQGEFRLSLIP